MGLRHFLLLRLRRSPVLLKLFRVYVDHKPIMLSLGLHGFIVLMAVCDFSVWMVSKPEKTISVPVMTVDLTNIPVKAITNLPPKLGQTQKSKSDKKSVKTSAYAAPKKTASSTMVVQKTSSERSDTTLVTTSRLDSVLNSVLKSKKPQESRPAPKKATAADDFQSLLASIDGGRGAAGVEAEEPDISPEEAVTQGIEGGQGGSYLRELSVSERDMLGIRLRQCWNTDAGVKGAQNMIVEIRAYLSPEGTVTDVKILNQARYRKDPAFRSVAESARRAVYICDDKKENSPFLVFPEYYAGDYDAWKTLLLRFNPLDGEIQ